MSNLSAYELFSIENPEAATWLGSFESVEGLEKVVSSQGEVNLKDTRKGQGRFIYDPQGSFESAFRWRQQFSLYKTDLFVVFGIGLGFEWQALLPWLESDPKKEVVFLEDDLGMLFHFLDSPLAQKILSHPRTKVYYIDGNEIGKRIFELLAWNSYKKTRQFAAISFYQTYRPLIAEKVEKKLRLQSMHVFDALDEFHTFGRIQIRSFLKNILAFDRARMASDMFKSFKGVPAIIVGAGPSLEGCLSELKKMQDKALILSGGTATNALLEAGIVPHLAATVDPNPTQYVRLKQSAPWAIPLFYMSRVIPEGIKSYPGQLLYLRGGCGHTLPEWFDTAIGISAQVIDGGFGVANMCVELAHRLGCGPIIMVGYDLSYPEGVMYPSVVQEALTEKEREQSGKKIPASCVAQANDGTNVATQEQWILEGQWIQKYFEKHPHMKLINTAQRGLKIGTIPCMSFQEVSAQYLIHSQAVSARVHRAIMMAKKVPFSFQRVEKALGSLALSIQEAIRLVDKMKAGDRVAEFELKEELVYRFFLSNYDRMREKKVQLSQIWNERLLVTNSSEREKFEESVQEEKFQCYLLGLQALSQWLCEFGSYAVFEGYYFSENSPFIALESDVSMPSYLTSPTK